MGTDTMEPRPRGVREAKRHSTLPWSVIGGRWNNEIVDEVGRDIAEALDHDVGIDECHANAAFIVRACNVHEDLLSRLEEAIAYLDGGPCEELLERLKDTVAKAKA